MKAEKPANLRKIPMPPCFFIGRISNDKFESLELFTKHHEKSRLNIFGVDRERANSARGRLAKAKG